MKGIAINDIALDLTDLLQPGSIAERIYNVLIEYRGRKEGKIEPPGRTDGGLFMTDEYDICCKPFIFSHEWEHSLTLPHVAQVFRVTDYLDIVHRADEIYETSGVEACQVYLGSGQVRDAIVAIDLGL